MKKYQNDYRYCLIRDMVELRPIISCSLIWMVLIPDIIKILGLSLVNVPFKTYLFTGATQYAIQAIIFSLVGHTMNHFDKLNATDSKGRPEPMSTPEIIESVVSIILLAVS